LKRYTKNRRNAGRDYTTSAEKRKEVYFTNAVNRGGSLAGKCSGCHTRVERKVMRRFILGECDRSSP